MPIVFSFVRALLTAGALLVGGALSAQAPLSLEEALRLATERSEALVAQDAAAAAARHMAIAGAQRPDPKLTAGIENLPINGTDRWSLSRDFMTMRSIGFMHELTRADKRDALAARYELEAEAAEARRALALSDLQRETATAWLDRYYAERMLDLLLAERDEAALQIDAAELAYRNGAGAQSDVFAARASVELLADRITTTQRDIDIANARLARWIGAGAERSLAPPPNFDVVHVEATDLAAHVAGHPMIDFMAKREEVARADAELARTQLRPDWSIDVMYNARSAPFSDMVSLRASRPIQWRQKNRQDRELAAKLAMAQQMRAEREEETRTHIAELDVLWTSWQTNRQRLEHYANSLVPLAAERTLAATAAYRGGGSLDAVLGARLNEIETRAASLDIEAQTARLWAELEYLVPNGHDAAAHE